MIYTFTAYKLVMPEKLSGLIDTTTSKEVQLPSTYSYLKDTLDKYRFHSLKYYIKYYFYILVVQKIIKVIYYKCYK